MEELGTEKDPGTNGHYQGSLVLPGDAVGNTV
jgi:hypothetical protein